MAENLQHYELSFHELCLAIVKAKGIHEGFWQLNFGFNFQATNLDLNQSGVKPSMIGQITTVGIVRCKIVDERSPGTVDASMENPVGIIIPEGLLRAN